MDYKAFLTLLGQHGFSAPTPAQYEQLAAYTALLLKWNKAINIIGRSTAQDVWQRHILDSYQLLPLVPYNIKTLLDIGAGAGLPSVILAIMRPDVAVTACEINTKKASFMNTVRRELALENFTVAHADVTQYTAPPFGLITARAYATMADIMQQSQYLSDASTAYLLPKGVTWKQELADAAAKNLTLNMTTHTICSITEASKKLGQAGRGQLVLLQPVTQP